MTVKSGSGDPPKVLAQLDLFKEESVSAINSLSVASSTATQFGHAAVAQSIDMVKNQMFVIYQSPDAEQVARRDFEALEAKVTEMQAKIQARGIPLTESFRCQTDYSSCMSLATTWGQRVVCRVTFVACLAQQFTTIIGRIG
jgi:hypothetical protein